MTVITLQALELEPDYIITDLLLEILTLACNQLTTLPEEIGNLSSLIFLNSRSYKL
jgi:Leucine-rich repeat (LRR) protein